MPEKVKVRIDGEVVAATPGQTILEVARANNAYIPALCYMEGLSAVGACRLCMVEISGVGKLQPACTTPVAEGLSVVTDSEQLASYRRMVLYWIDDAKRPEHPRPSAAIPGRHEGRHP